MVLIELGRGVMVPVYSYQHTHFITVMSNVIEILERERERGHQLTTNHFILVSGK